MRVKISKSKNSESLYIMKSIYVNGKNTSKIVEKLGTIEEVRVKANDKDPYEWARNRAKKLTEQQEKNILVKYSPTRQLPLEEQQCYNGGYLFIQQLYNQIGLPEICHKVENKYKFQNGKSKVQ